MNMRKVITFGIAFVAILLAGWATNLIPNFLNVQEEAQVLDESEMQDVTDKIVNPQFDNNDSGWTWIEKGSCKVTTSGGNTSVTGNYEKWEIQQTITGLQPGFYTLKVQGFGRLNSNDDSWAHYLAGNTDKSSAFVYANDAELEVVNIATGPVDSKGSGSYSQHQTADGKTVYLLNNSASAAEVFAQGKYDNTLTGIIVGNDGVLTIGFKKTSNVSTSDVTKYAGCDNFRLYYNGLLDNISSDMIAALEASAPTGKMNAGVKSAMDTAVQAMKSNPAADTYLAAKDAIDAAKASADAYAHLKAALDKADGTELGSDAQAELNAAIASIKSGYEAGTISGDCSTEIDAVEKAIMDAKQKDLEGKSDVTSLLQNPNFESGTTGWSGNFGNGAKKGLASNYVITSYGGGFDVYQTLENLNPGIYKIKAQAFTRPTDNDNTWNSFYGGTELVNETYLYANDVQKKVKFIVEDYMTSSQSDGTWSTYSKDGGTAYVPNNSSAFSIAMTAGLYENEIICVVGEDGKLKLGIKNLDNDNGASYAGFDNFRLYYLGSADLTSVIVNPQFENGTEGWSGDFGAGAKKGLASNYVITCYGTGFDIYQDLTDLTPGTYKLEAQAFTRPASNDDTWNAFYGGQSLVNETYLYAGSKQQAVKFIVEDYMTSSQSDGTWSTYSKDGGTAYVPNNSSAFSIAFSAGLYQNELLCNVGEDGKLRIGIKNLDSGNGATYAGFDNFRLTYISSDYKSEQEDEPEMLTNESVIADIAKYDAVASQAADHAAYDEVSASVKTALTQSNQTYTQEELAELKGQVIAALGTLMKTGDTTTGTFDLTSLINNNDFAKNIKEWKTTNGSFTWTTGMLQGKNITGGEKFYQTLAGMPAGKYTLKVQGYYQACGWKQALYDKEHGLEENKLNLFLNDESVKVKSIFDNGRATLASDCISRTEDVGSTIDGRGFPLMLSKVEETLSPGGYWTMLEVTKDEDGDITFGVELEETDLADNWIILDNFRLYYGTRKPMKLTSANLAKIKDDTRMDVIIAKSYVADSLYAFSAPCDIPGNKFKGVYEIGSLTSDNKAIIYPVENVRAGVPCYIEFANNVDTLLVENTIVKPEKPDNMPVIWEGGLIVPYYQSLIWRSINMAGSTINPTKFTPEKVDLMNMSFTANVENYQVRRFLNTKYTATNSSVVATYNAVSPARRDLAHSVGIPVPASKAEGAVVKYGLKADLSDAREAKVIDAATVCYIPNLIPQNTYFYQVVAANNEIVSKGSFNVSGNVRMLYAPSVYNLRDLGGWTMPDGKITRYGLIYRGGEVNGYHAPYYGDLETLKGIGMGAELDLRYNDSYDQDRETNKSGYGFVKGDTYYFAGANDYTSEHLSQTDTQARLKEEFRFLLGHIREGRGVHFHCVFGADRTGFFACLIEGLLGFDINQMCHDYEFTSFAAPAGNRNKSTVVGHINVIQKESGTTLRDKFETYWVEKVGITKEEVEEFRTIMLRDPFVTEDVNRDGNVNSLDVLKVYKYMQTSTGSDAGAIEDVNGDNSVNSLDVLKIYKYMQSH